MAAHNTTKEGVMPVMCELVGNVFATYWDGVISAEDAQTVVSKTNLASGQIREPLVAMAIMAPTVKRPTIEAGKFIYANHPKMQELHQSIHIVVLARGAVAAGLKVFATLNLIGGTGGKLCVHDTVEQAWAEAEKFGRVHVPMETVLTRLRFKGASI